MNNRETAVVVGGGIAGLTAALALGREFVVVVVDKDAACGGLLKSRVAPDGAVYDLGTHVMGETQDAETNRLLFKRLYADDWNRFRAIKAGSFFGGKLNAASPHVDVRALPPELAAAAARELQDAPACSPGDFRDLAAYLTRQFGPTIAERVQRPALRKIFGVELEELQPDNPFALKRVIAFAPEVSRELKKTPRLDGKLAFNSYDEGVGSIHYFAPKTGGVGRWVDGLCADIAAAGGTFANGRFIAAIERRDGHVVSVTLDDGRKIACALLAWTVPPFLLLKALGAAPKGAPLKPRPTGLYYFRFDRPFLTENHYVTCYDEDLKIFRVTMFPNLRGPAAAGIHNCTVEVIGDGAAGGREEEIRAELTRMGLVAADAKILWSGFEALPAGFPAVTHAFAAAAAEQAAAARAACPEALLLGRAKHDAFSTEAVTVEAVRRVGEFLKARAAAP